MKHSFITLIALLMSISYAFAEGTHTVKFYDDYNNPDFLLIVDQYNNSYSVKPNGSATYTISDGTILTFSLTPQGVSLGVVVKCYDETPEAVGDGMLSTGFTTFTIDETTPKTISFSTGAPTYELAVKLPNVCSAITEIRVNGMIRTDYFCQSHEDGYEYILFPGLDNGDEVKLISQDPIDWGDGEINNEHTKTVTGPTIIIGTDVWDDNNPDHYTSTKPGPLTITYINRTIFSGMWNPICFPFKINQAKMEQIFGVNTVVQFEDATFSEADGLIVECSYVTGGMLANTPYLVKPETDLTNMKFEEVGVQDFSEGRVNSNNGVNFVGVVSPTDLRANDKTKLFIGAGNKVYYPDQDMTLKGLRAYFDIPSGVLSVQGRKPGAARFIIRDRQAPTGLENNVMNKNTSKKYMQNGRLVIENNGVRYNAQGMQLD